MSPFPHVFVDCALMSVLQTMTDSFRRELQKFDKERVLPAWDGLIARQQATLESLGVPAMYPTTAAEDRKVRLWSSHQMPEASLFGDTEAAEDYAGPCRVRGVACALRWIETHPVSLYMCWQRARGASSWNGPLC